MRQTCFVREEEIDVICVIHGDFDLATGECAAPTETIGKISGNIQPISGNTLQRLPEGRRDKAIYSMWTSTPLDLETLIMYKGARFEIEQADDWDQPSSTLPHYKYIMLRQGNRGHFIAGGYSSARS